VNEEGSVAGKEGAVMSRGFEQEDKTNYPDMATVESQRNDLAFEEFPEGPYGSSIPSATLGKSTPWREDQRSPGRFDYEDHEQHEGMTRNYPGEDVYDAAVPDGNHDNELKGS